MPGSPCFASDAVAVWLGAAASGHLGQGWGVLGWQLAGMEGMEVQKCLKALQRQRGFKNAISAFCISLVRTLHHPRLPKDVR